MKLKDSKYTLSANLVNQTVSIILFLTVPNILGQDEYAKIVYISVLLSFLVLSDFGMSFVYGKVMPSIFHKNNQEEIEKYNQTFFWFRLITSFIGSIVVSILYYIKFGVFSEAFLLILLNPLSLIMQFFIQQYSLKEDYKVYRNLNVKNSLFRILILPFSYVGYVSGWIFAKIIASVVVLKSIKGKFFYGINQFDINIIKSHFFEGIMLVVNFFFWQQLLNSGRLFASMYYEPFVISQYGLANAGYSILQQLIISVFLPVTVATFKIVKDETAKVIELLFGLIFKVSIITFFVVIFAIEVSPYLYEIFFPKFHLNSDILKYQLLSLMTIPIIATLGNIFVGTGKLHILILIYAIGFFSSYIFVNTLDSGELNATLAQFYGTTLMGILLFFAIIYFYKDYIKNKLFYTIKILGTIFIPYGIYFIIKGTV